MLLQRQYSLWKMFNIFISVLILVSIISGIYFKWQISSLENQVNKELAKKNKVEQDINKLLNSSLYSKYILAKKIDTEYNNTNYAGLYEYLRSIRDEIKKSLKNKTNLSRFDLKVDKGRVMISLLLPSYNLLYEGNSIIDKLSSKNFVKKIEINSFKSKENLIFTKINLETK